MTDLETLDTGRIMNRCKLDFVLRQPPSASSDSEPCGAEGNTVNVQTLTPPTGTLAETESFASSRLDYSGITIYLREIGRIKRLTRVEEVDLVARHRQGDREAREHLITANLRLVVAVARGFEGSGLPLLDLISEGNIALTRAVDGFDPDRGAALATYAFVRVRSAVTRAVYNYGRTVRVPVNVYEDWGKLRRAERQLHGRFEREATVEELAEHLGSSVARVSLIRRAVLCPLSLDEEGEVESHSKSMLELIGDENLLSPSDELDRSSGAATLLQCLKHLRPAEAETLVRRFGLHGGEEMTLEAIGQEMGITREGVRQIERRAMKKLRRLMRHTRA